MEEKKALTSYTCTVNAGQIAQIRRDLEARGFSFDTVPYAHYRARKEKVNLVAYESGKLVVQGQGTQDLVQFYLEPEVLGEARLGYEHLLDPEFYETRIGVDESGKGDYFGPLVTAGVLVDATVVELWRNGGIQDSKRIKSAKRIDQLVRLIQSTNGAVAKRVVVGNRAYNRLHKKMRNVNNLLGWAHARAIEDVLGVADAPKAISDQFGDPAIIKRSLMQRGKKIELIQRTKAESDMAVAAASIIARGEFVQRLEQMEKKWDTRFPPGASRQVREAAVEFVKKHGAEDLVEVAKIHFRTTEQVLQEAGIEEWKWESIRQEWNRRMEGNG
jgi:ribonuclease HIII